MLQTVINSDEDAVKTVNEILRYSSIWLSIREYIHSKYIWKEIQAGPNCIFLILINRNLIFWMKVFLYNFTIH